ncbi:hypothetical protein SDC9_204589 [bioreactor metagenome]|uniref:Uncharacterized protein n=1 Tax=bioreactor metagenome TaxID=1076179 RepID=A0A645J0C3_9ZZZZ
MERKLYSGRQFTHHQLLRQHYLKGIASGYFKCWESGSTIHPKHKTIIIKTFALQNITEVNSAVRKGYFVFRSQGTNG